MFKKILLCSDGSDRALEAAKIAAGLAKTHQAQLTLLHVCPIPNLQPSFPGAPTFEGPALDRYVREMHLAVIERTLPVITEQDVRCAIREETGNPVNVIARVANTQGFDLVVLGSRGFSTERANQLGSVSHGVIHNVCCPTLIVR